MSDQDVGSGVQSLSADPGNNRSDQGIMLQPDELLMYSEGLLI